MKCHANAAMHIIYLAFLGSKRKGPASLLRHLHKHVFEVFCWQHRPNTAMRPNIPALGSRKLMQDMQVHIQTAVCLSFSRTHEQQGL